ncbi:MAG: serpin family protein [Sphaerochaeta sp.]|nr:serpin family protein [Sphaerochaeta sp.]
MKRYSVTVLVLLITTMLGCAGLKEPTTPEPTGQPAETDQQFFTRSVQSFSDQLFFVEGFNEKNAMLSPLSVLLAMGMTANGADGSTLSSMLDVLVAKQGTLEQFNAANTRYLTGVQGLKDVQLSIANSLWLNKDILFDQAFLTKTKGAYQATAKSLDFSARSSLKTINSWVSEATRGTIPSILDSLDPYALMYLVNAVYFKGDWMTPFTKEGTYPKDFFLKGSTVETPFMHQSASFPYAEALDAQMLMMPYTNERFALVAILPPHSSDLSSWLAAQKSEGSFTQRLFTSADSMEMTRMELSFPKFELSYKDSLAKELKTLGMADPFDGSKADFSRMTENRSKALVIEDVLHKTFIRVDEKGSEAAAVTSVMIKMTSMPMREELELHFNRPFFYAIIDREARIPLFMGTMENPASQ